jgi:uroporphyrinogen-III synthase
LREHRWTQQRVLVVRGDGGREWLAGRLREAGAQVELVRAYRRVPPRWSAPQQALAAQALAEPQRTVWLLSSSQAVEQLGRLLPHAAWSAAQAWATHARIAQAAAALGFGTVLTVAPTPQAAWAQWSSAPWAQRGPSIQSAALPNSDGDR